MSSPPPVPPPVGLANLKQFCIRCEKQPFVKDGDRKNSFTSTGWSLHPKDWMTFAEAEEALQRGAKVWHDGRMQPATGIGFLVARSSDDVKRPLGGDIDCCRSSITGIISPWAAAFLREILPFYTEVSPSGAGLRFFCWGHLPNGLDNVFGTGSQDDLTEADKEAILEAKPKAREKLAKGQPVFNGLEIYEANRHLSITGTKLEGYCYSLNAGDRTVALSEALKVFLADPVTKGAGKSRLTKKSKNEEGMGRFPALNILDVIETGGFTESGGQLFGSHPTEGSTTGRNLVVNPAKNLWAWMHDGINSGGDPWVFLACECGAVPWARAGAGVLKDFQVVRKTLEHAVKRGLVSEEILESRSGCQTTASIKLGEALLLVDDLKDRETIKQDPGLPFEAKYIDALAIVKKHNQPEYERVRAILKGLVSVRDLNKKVDGKAREIDTLVRKDQSEEQEEASPDIKVRALEILQHGNPIQFIADSCGRMVLGAETAFKKLCCCVAVQDIKQSEGLHPKLNGESGSGKTKALLAFSHHLPQEAVVTGSMSNKSVFYHNDGNHVIRILDDYQAGNEDLDTIIKQTSSVFHEKYKHKTVINQQPVILEIGSEQTWAITSVDSSQDIQVLNRQIPINIDDSAELTRLVNKKTIERYTKGEAQFIEDETVQVCREIWRILRAAGGINVRVPFGDRIDWLDISNRRNPSIFMDILIAHTAMNRYQRVKDSEGVHLAEEEDFQAAKALFTDKDAEELVKRLTRKEREFADLLSKHPGGLTREEAAEALNISISRVSQLAHGEKEKGGLTQKLPGFSFAEITDSEFMDGGDGKRRSTKRTLFKLTRYDPITGFGAVVILRDKNDNINDRKDRKEAVRESVRVEDRKENSNSKRENRERDRECKDRKEKERDGNIIHPSELEDKDKISFSLGKGKKSLHQEKSTTEGPKTILTPASGNPNGPYTKAIDSESKSLHPNIERIKAAAISEFGMAGWVDPTKLSLILRLPLEDVTTWLEANYTAYERPGGGIGYRQRRAGEAPA
ncbi:MAG: hypothetical protein NTU95_05595 [Methanothrix sp.]|nr:hypothetical protein [Methanothrix sp.]